MERGKQRIEEGFGERSRFLQQVLFLGAVDGELRCVRLDLGDHHVPEVGQQLREHRRGLFPVGEDLGKVAERFAAFPAQDMAGQRKDAVLAGEAQQLVHHGRSEGLSAGGAGALVQQGQGVAQAPFGADGDEVRRFLREAEAALLCNI